MPEISSTAGALAWAEISSGSGGLDLKMLESGQGVEQPATSPIEDVIVAKHAAVDGSGLQAVRILGAHSVIDAFWHVILAASDARFEIDDARVRFHTVQFLQGYAPNV